MKGSDKQMIFLNKVDSMTITKGICYPDKKNRLDRGTYFILPCMNQEDFLFNIDQFISLKSNLRLRMPKMMYVPYMTNLKYRVGNKKWTNKKFKEDVKIYKNRGFAKVGYMGASLGNFNGFIDVSRIATESMVKGYTVAGSYFLWENLLKNRIDTDNFESRYLVFTPEIMKVRIGVITTVTAKNGLNSDNMYMNFLYNLRFHFNEMKALLQENDINILFTDWKWTIRVNHSDLDKGDKEFFKDLFFNLRRLKTGIPIDDEVEENANEEGLVFEDDDSDLNDTEEPVVDEEVATTLEKLSDKDEDTKIVDATMNKLAEISTSSDSQNTKQSKADEAISELVNIIKESQRKELPEPNERLKKVVRRQSSLQQKNIIEIEEELERAELGKIDKKVSSAAKGEFGEFKIENMNSQYEKTARKTRVEIGDNLNNAKIPLFLSKYKEKNDTSKDTSSNVVSYTFSSPNDAKQTHSFTVRVPKLRDGKYLYLNGSDKVMVRQKIALPVVHLKDRVLFTSYFGKMFFSISRGNITTTEGKIKRYIKLIRKKYSSVELAEFFNFVPAYFDNAKNNRMNTELLEISRYLSSVRVESEYINLNSDSEFLAYVDNHTYKITQNDEIEDDKGNTILFVELFNKLLSKGNSEILDLWKPIYKKKETTIMSYSNVQLLGRDTPLVLVILHSLDENLLTLLEKMKKDYGLEYHITPDRNGKRAPKLYSEYEGNRFLFNGFSLDVKYKSPSNRLLLEYLNQIDLTGYDSLNLSGLCDSVFNSRHIMNMENYEDFFIDNVATKQVMEDMGIPTDYPDALLYCNSLLTNYDREIKEVSLENERMPPTSEIINGVLYKEMAKSMIDYSNKVKKGSKSATFAVDRDAVIKSLLTLPNVEESSKLNIIQHVDKSYTISNKGVSGINEERAYTEEKVRWDESFYGTMSDVSPFTKQSGVSKHLAMNPNITDMKGYFKPKKPSETQDDEIMSVAESLAPFAQKHDSAARLGMMMSQFNHTVNVKGAQPSLVTYGMDETIADIDTDFNHKMRDDGKVIAINPRFVKVVYDTLKDEKGEPMQEVFSISKIERNAAKAKYILNDMRLNPNLNIKVGKKLKKGDVIAYNKDFYNTDGIDISYKPGPIALVAITNNQSSFEDATVMNRSLANKLGTVNLKRVAVKLSPRSNLAQFAQIGDIKPGDIIAKYSEDTGSDTYNYDIDVSLLEDYLLKTKKSHYRGKIRDIYISYKLTKEELENMHPSIKKLFSYVEKYYNSNYDTRVMGAGLEEFEKNRNTDFITAYSGSKKAKVNGDSVDKSQILVEFFIEVETPFSIGDKLIFGSSALKGVCSKIVPDDLSPYGKTTGRKIDIILSTLSPSARMIYSFFLVSLLTAGMQEVNKHIREKILNIK